MKSATIVSFHSEEVEPKYLSLFALFASYKNILKENAILA